MEYPVAPEMEYCAACRGNIRGRYKEAHGLKFHAACFVCVNCKERLYHGFFVEKDADGRRFLTCADCSTKRFMKKKAAEQAKKDALEAQRRLKEHEERQAKMTKNKGNLDEDAAFDKFFGAKKKKRGSAYKNIKKRDNYEYVPPSGPRKELPATPGADVEYEYITPEADVHGRRLDHSGAASHAPKFQSAPSANPRVSHVRPSSVSHHVSHVSHTPSNVSQPTHTSRASHVSHVSHVSRASHVSRPSHASSHTSSISYAGAGPSSLDHPPPPSEPPQNQVDLNYDPFEDTNDEPQQLVLKF